MSEEEREAALADLGYKAHSAGGATAAAALALFRSGGFTSYKIALIVINYLWKLLFGRGLTLVANAGIARVLGILAGPIGWTLTGQVIARPYFCHRILIAPGQQIAQQHHMVAAVHRRVGLVTIP